jgi:hypothetical protein
MGAWGTGVFENDWALDYAVGLAKSGDADSPAAILRALDGPGDLDSRECATALAAAEAVAASSGQPAADLPDPVLMWFERTGARADAQEVQLALRVVGMILDQNSGLRDQRDETGASLAEWLTPIEDLQRRLRAAVPAPAAGPDAAQSPSRRLHGLAARRGPSGSRSRDGVPGVECAWRKVRGGVLFALRDARGLAVTLDTSYGGQQRGLAASAGLRRHAPLYVWGDAVGTWPRNSRKLTRCPVYQEEYHWDDVAEAGTSVDLVNRWLAADGDDEVIWAELDREHDALTRRFEEFMLSKRAVIVSELEKRGRPEDASKLAGWDLPRIEAWLVAGEKKRITAEKDRSHERVKRYLEGMAAVNTRHANAQPDQTAGNE